MKRVKMISCLCLLFCLLTFTGCATYQPIKARVVLHPTQYQHFITYEGISAAAIPFNPQRSMYADPQDPAPPKPTYNLPEAGIYPVRLIFFNESNGPVYVDPAQVTCSDTNGTIYQPFNETEAGDTIVASQAFRSWVKGAVAGAVVGSLVGTALGAAIGGAIGGHHSAGRGAVIGGVAGGASGAAEGGMAFQIETERRIRLMLARDHLKPITISPGGRNDGMILCPAVDLQAVQILLEDPEYQWSQQIEMPLKEGPESGPEP